MMPLGRLRLWLLAFAALVALVGAGMAAGQELPPSLPALAYGELTLIVDGEARPAPAGALVVAKVEGIERGRLTTEAVGRYGGPSTQSKLAVSGEGLDGKTVEFFVSGSMDGISFTDLPAGQHLYWGSGEVQKIDLMAPDEAKPTPTPVPEVIDESEPTLTPAPEVINEVRAPVIVAEATRIETPDGRTRVRVPSNSLPPDLADQTIEIVLKTLNPATVPPPPPNRVFVRAIQINSLVNGVTQVVNYLQPVTVTVLLTQEDLDLAGGDPDRLAVLRFNEGTGLWDVMPATFLADPPPGRLEVTLTSFSLFAVGVAPAPTPTLPPARGGDFGIGVPFTPTPVAQLPPTATPGPTPPIVPPTPPAATLVPTPAPEVPPAAIPPTPVPSASLADEVSPAGLAMAAVAVMVLLLTLAGGANWCLRYYRRRQSRW